MKISIIVRTLNEARHLNDLLAMVGRQKLDHLTAEVILIDSGSTDETVAIARRHGCKITSISRDEFSFGRSLNRGSAFSSGDILVYISGHCVPVDEYWLQRLCQPLLDGMAAYSYGRQIGDNDSNYSERRTFAKYFPDQSAVPQEGFFCNNANSALLRDRWYAYRFDEELTGLEDMELAQRLSKAGEKIAYVADAPVFHHHNESWTQIRRRFEREAIALRSIMPEIQLSLFDILFCVVSSTWGDWRMAARHKIHSTTRLDMLRYRWNQYIGSFKGNRHTRRLSRQAKERFFYPQVHDTVTQDGWLGPLHRTPPHEIEQRKG